jgi:hypothetical protein
MKTSKAKLRLLLIFGSILLIEFLFSFVFPGWSLREGALIKTNNILAYFAFFGFLFCIVSLFKMFPPVLVIMGTTSAVLFCFLSCTELFPIDTTTDPVDVKTLWSSGDNRKLVVREYQNAKTNATIRDTVLVKDILIFRHVYPSQGNGHLVGQ